MELIFFLILEGSCAHAALERVLKDVRLDVGFQVVGLCKLLLANLKSESQQSIQASSSTSLPTYITFIRLRIRVLLHVLVEFTLDVEHFVADVAEMWLFLGMFPHVREKLVARREGLVAQGTVGRMVVAVRSQMRRKVVLLIETFLAECAFCG